LITPEEDREREIMKLLLRIKNGTPVMRKQAMRQITDRAREFGPGPLFNQILPLVSQLLSLPLSLSPFIVRFEM
jgi:splicing factor 3B subunit 1